MFNAKREKAKIKSEKIPEIKQEEKMDEVSQDQVNSFRKKSVDVRKSNLTSNIPSDKTESNILLSDSSNQIIV